MTTSMDEQQFYYPELDGLRFVAFMLVFIHNAPNVELGVVWNALHEYGWIGVDLFFCLSAFLITRLLISEQHIRGKISIKNFYIRRVLRIWPLYFFYILIATIFILEDQGWKPILVWHFIGLITFTYNLVYLFLTHKIYIVLAHLWTISYETQFYFVIPLIVRRLASGKKNLTSVFFCLALISGNLVRGVLIVLQVKHPAIYMLPFTHFEAILGGIAVGLGLFDRLFKTIPIWALFVLGLIGNAGVFFLPNTYDIQWMLMLTYPLAGFGMTLIVFTITNGKTLLTTRVLNNKLLIYLGKISYGLYIYHFLAISLIDLILVQVLRINPQETAYYSAFLFTLSFLLNVALSSVSFQLFEKQFLKLKIQFSLIPSHPV